VVVESLFAGEPVDLTRPEVLWPGDFRPVSEIPPPARHAAGYEPFVALITATGAEPVVLAADVRKLVAHLHQQHATVRDAGDDLLDSAGIFLGNSLIARVEDGRWERLSGSELEVTQGDGGVEVLRMIRAIIDADDHRLREFDDFLRLWDATAGTQRARAAAEDAAERRLELVQEPVVPSTPFKAPPSASLVGLLRALLDHLATHYEVTVERRAALDEDPRTISPTIETIRVEPAVADGAPLTIAIDEVGAVAIRAGAFSDFFFYGPDAAELESTLLAVAAGRYRETYLPEAGGIGGYRVGFIDRPGGSSARGPVDRPPGELAAIAGQLQAVPDGWAPWPLRTEATR
jgi:hypothetical protein